jgi:hypothetical protein
VWKRTVRETSYAFPHHLEELTDYGKYVNSLIVVMDSTFHIKVISFNKVVRWRVGSARGLELSGHNRFSDIKLAYIDSITAAVTLNPHTSGIKLNKSLTKKQEPCNRWNSGLCTLSGTIC